MNQKVEIIMLLSLVVLVVLSESHGSHGTDKMDAAHVRDPNHIKDHLEGVIQEDNTKDMSPEELEFHYFKLHDFDNNNKLDGNEIAKAMTHYGNDNKDDITVMSDKDISELVDSVLDEEDTNNDGYIDYTEFRRAQNKHKTEN